jgi:16S rRNA (uracil1498-N3)-methyltransferase
MRLFYDPTISKDSTSHILNEVESKHIIKVLRLKEGDNIGLLNGSGSTFICTITDANAKKCSVSIDSVQTSENPEYDIHIAVAPTKQNERLEWFVEKATEIGVTRITPITTKNSERIRLKEERLIKKAISAMKQSNRLFLPQIDDLTDITSFIRENPNGLIAHCYNEERNDLEDVFQSNSCPILIGPEGDFTPEEIELAFTNGYKSITLGENRLRTETAALYAVMRSKLKIEK